MSDFEILTSPESPLALAEAIARRELAEEATIQEQINGALGISAEPIPVELKTALAVTKTNFLLAQIENTRTGSPVQMTFEDVFNDLFDQKSLDVLLRSSGLEETSEEDRAEIKTFLHSIISSVGFESDVPLQALALERQLTEAGYIATMHGVSVADVYRDEDLWLETLRSTTTVDELVDGAVAQSAKIKEQVVEGLMESIMTGLAHELGKEEGMSEEEINAELEGMRTDEDFLQAQAGVLDIYKQAARQSVIARIKRIWGIEYDDISVANREKIESIGGGSGIPEVFSDSVKRTMDNDTARRLYCIEKGWDVNNLTAEQLGEISRLPSPDIHEEVVDQPLAERLTALSALPMAEVVEADGVLSPVDRAVAAYCELQGWDPAQLRFDQNLELRQYLRDNGYNV